MCVRGERVPPPPARRAARPPLCCRRSGPLRGGTGGGETQRERMSESGGKSVRGTPSARENEGEGGSRGVCAREREAARERPCGSVGRVRVREPASGPGSPRLCRPSTPAWRGETPTSLPRCVREEMPLFFSFCMCVCVNTQGSCLSLRSSCISYPEKIPPFTREK